MNLFDLFAIDHVCPDPLLDYFDGFQKERQLQIQASCREVDRLYQQYKEIVIQSKSVSDKLEKVVEWALIDCEFIVPKKEWRINIPVLLSIQDILYEKKAITLVKLENELTTLQDHRRVCLEHAEMNMSLGQQLREAGLEFKEKLILYLVLISADILVRIADRIESLSSNSTDSEEWDVIIQKIIEKRNEDCVHINKRKRSVDSPQESSKRIRFETIPNSIPNESIDARNSTSNESIDGFKRPIPSQISDKTTPIKSLQTPALAGMTQNQFARVHEMTSPFQSTGQESEIHRVYPDERQDGLPSSLEPVPFDSRNLNGSMERDDELPSSLEPRIQHDDLPSSLRIEDGNRDSHLETDELSENQDSEKEEVTPSLENVIPLNSTESSTESLVGKQSSVEDRDISFGNEKAQSLLSNRNIDDDSPPSVPIARDVLPSSLGRGDEESQDSEKHKELPNEQQDLITETSFDNMDPSLVESIEPVDKTIHEESDYGAKDEKGESLSLLVAGVPLVHEDSSDSSAQSQGSDVPENNAYSAQLDAYNYNPYCFQSSVSLTSDHSQQLTKIVPDSQGDVELNSDILEPSLTCDQRIPLHDSNSQKSILPDSEKLINSCTPEKENVHTVSHYPI